MKVLLRRLRTGEYLRHNGEWTSEPALARDFVRVTDAVEFALRAELVELRVFLYEAERRSNPQLKIAA